MSVHVGGCGDVANKLYQILIPFGLDFTMITQSFYHWKDSITLYFAYLKDNHLLKFDITATIIHKLTSLFPKSIQSQICGLHRDIHGSSVDF